MVPSVGHLSRPPAKPSPTVKKKSADDLALRQVRLPESLQPLALGGRIGGVCGDGALVDRRRRARRRDGVDALRARLGGAAETCGSTRSTNKNASPASRGCATTSTVRCPTPIRRARKLFFDAVARIRKLALENPSMTAELVRAELVKLDGLTNDFLDLAIMASKGEAHLRMVNFEHLNALWRRYQDQAKAFPSETSGARLRRRTSRSWASVVVASTTSRRPSPARAARWTSSTTRCACSATRSSP